MSASSSQSLKGLQRSLFTWKKNLRLVFAHSASLDFGLETKHKLGMALPLQYTISAAGDK